MSIKPILLLVAALVAPAAAQENTHFAETPVVNGEQVLLYQAVGPCEGAARQAVHVARTGARTRGCWVIADQVVLVSFLDGERGDIPVAVLRKPKSA